MKTYVIHVSDAYERERYMQRQLEGKKLDVEYVLDGDKTQISTAQLEKYFKGSMASATAATSCALKHILACERLVKSNEKLALVLEDDIRFYANFSDLEKIVAELTNRKLSNLMVSLEDSCLKYVPRSQRVKNVMLYPQTEGRLAGAYLIDREGAQSLLDCIAQEKLDMPIDWYHTKCVRSGVLQMFWSHPTLAIQGSLDGSIDSLIDSGKHGVWRPVSFAMQKAYKKLLYFFR